MGQFVRQQRHRFFHLAIEIDGFERGRSFFQQGTKAADHFASSLVLAGNIPKNIGDLVEKLYAAPGMVETPMTQGMNQKARDALVEAIPVGRIGTPEDVARAVDFLCGPGGAYVTGQVLVVDGGLSM